MSNWARLATVAHGRRVSPNQGYLGGHRQGYGAGGLGALAFLTEARCRGGGQGADLAGGPAGVQCVVQTVSCASLYTCLCEVGFLLLWLV